MMCLKSLNVVENMNILLMGMLNKSFLVRIAYDWNVEKSAFAILRSDSSED